MKWLINFIVISILALHGFGQNEKSCSANDHSCLHVVALVPARAGSKGIKNKNLSLLGNETLLGKSLRIINECGKFDSVWVSTDGNSIAQEAAKYAKIHWRNPLTATDNASTFSVVKDFLLEHRDYQIVAIIQCTSPFIQSDYLCKAIDYFLENDVDCVFSVVRSHQLRWIEKKDAFVSPLNFDTENRPRRQDWRGELVETGMFYFAKTNLILENGVLQNKRCKGFEISKENAFEIDSEFDLELARMILSIRQEKINN